MIFTIGAAFFIVGFVLVRAQDYHWHINKLDIVGSGLSIVGGLLMGYSIGSILWVTLP